MKEREKKILEYMKTEIREKGYPPTVREICSALGIKSTSTVHKDIANLEKEGYLKKDPARPRALLVADEGFDQLAAVRAASEAALTAASWSKPSSATRSARGLAGSFFRYPSFSRLAISLWTVDVDLIPRAEQISLTVGG